MGCRVYMVDGLMEMLLALSLGIAHGGFVTRSAINDLARSLCGSGVMKITRVSEIIYEDQVERGSTVI